MTNRKENRFLRKKTAVFDFSKHTKEEIRMLIQKMKKAMHAANGIGLSANQIGLSYRLFVAYLPAENGGYKFYSIFNPVLEKLGKETAPFEEGCLSVPGIYGAVLRPERVTLTGFDKYGKPVKVKAWGLLARVFQHEMDHLNGYLFTDRTKILHKVDQKQLDG